MLNSKQPAMVSRFWNNHSLPILLVLLLTAPSVLSLLQAGTVSGFDLQYHIVKLEQFHRCLQDGQILARWLPDMGGGYGYPDFLYYPPLIYWAAIPFVWAGMTYPAAMEATIGLALIACAFAMYALVSRRFDQRAGVLGAVAVTYAPYHLVTAYVKGAVAEVFSFVWIPLIFLVLCRLREQPTPARTFFLACLYAALILTNNSSALLFSLPFLAFIVLAGWRDAHARFVKFAMTGLLFGLLFSAFFWVPALWERDLVQLSKMVKGYFDFGQHFISFAELAFSKWGYGPSGYPDQFSRSIGLPHILFLAAGIVACIKKRDFDGLFVACLVCISIFMALKPSTFVWETFPLLQYLQFPWKFLALIMIATSFLSGYLLLLPRREEWRWGLFAALLVMLVALNASHARPARSTSLPADFPTPRQVSLLTMQGMQQSAVVHYFTSYLPVQVEFPPRYIAANKVVPKDGITLVSENIRTDRYEFRIMAENSTWLVVNTFWFPGWKAFLDGRSAEVVVADRNGRLGVAVPPGEHVVLVVFDNTPVRFWSLLLSVGSFLVFPAMVFGSRYLPALRKGKGRNIP